MIKFNGIIKHYLGSVCTSICRTAVNELQNLHYLPRVSEPREFLAEDRTKCHADHVGHGLDRQTTAAVGVLKAIHVGGRFVLNMNILIVVIVFLV